MTSSLSEIRLSVLDISPIVDGSSAREALANTQALAQLADRLGYHRYWVPEHHSMPGVASAAPAVVIAQLANRTARIRVGSGGVLLYNHAPIVIAEQFGTLEAYNPGRVDLGLGRSFGGSRKAAAVVRTDEERLAKTYDEQVEELLRYFAAPAQLDVRAIPAIGNAPPVWLLGSTEVSAALAARLGLPFAFAHHLQPGTAESALRTYRESFQPSDLLKEPYVLVSVSAVVAETDDHAQFLAGSNKLKVLSRTLKKSRLLPSPEEAVAFPYTQQHLDFLEERFASVVIGCPETAEKQLQLIRESTSADELMITTQIFDFAARCHSYELLAEVWGCNTTSPTPAPWEARSAD